MKVQNPCKHLLLYTLSVTSIASSSVNQRDYNSQDSLRIGPSTVEVSASFRNIFPAENFNRNVSVPWWHTEILSGNHSTVAQSALTSLEDANFIVFNKAFYNITGVHDYLEEKSIERIFQFPPGPAYASRTVHDGTAYSPECNCIFFAELHPPKTGFSSRAMPWIWRTNLNVTPPVTEKVYPGPQLTMGNGAFYHNGSVYWAQEGNYTVPGGVVKMNPLTLETQVVLNNFLGHRFNSPNDIVITRSGIAYFTDGYYGYENFNDTLKPQLANGVWRWDITSGDVRQVAGAGTGIFLNPNGIALSPGDDYLYVTARGKTSADADGQRTISRFEVQASGARGPPLRNVEIFAYADAGFPDGIKVDAEGRVYGGATGGVDVWSQSGELLGKINVAKEDVAVNMIWVEDWFYIVGRSYLYRVQLAVGGA